MSTRMQRTPMARLAAGLLAAMLAAAPAAKAQDLAALESAVVERLTEVVAAEAAGETDTEAQVALMARLTELVAGWQAAGKSLRSVERRLEYRAVKAFGRDVPALLTGPDGRLDVAALVEQAASAVGRATRKPARADPYLSAIAAEGQSTTVATARIEVASAPATPEPEPAVAGEASAEPDAFGERIEVEGGARYVTVVPGDTLGRLAAEIYGDFFEYRQIYVANRDRISNPNLLAPGTRLRIP
ncbi:hypothetical protein LNKW23_19790 [Paralimibaculum aggregatum]|uniref:LysM domain-containing protein n=1 Tax=Paralimibaculum aggregatum TaxID=3036245 RepID=A0ABQ6LK19_9RHOB|nr:LysM peptidoglycan-binding domain-containing protein [Limibaculum sp. NKW23]GMG82766.1 hypothetical protein LNKW23_19790 [Limibaculum sp. NKW23]